MEWICKHTSKMMAESVEEGACPLCLMIELNQKRERVRLLRKGIQDYLDGRYGIGPIGKIDKCEHGRFGYEDCECCVDRHFMDLLEANP